MPEQPLYQIIQNMHKELDRILEEHDFDLLHKRVLNYSRRLDKVILRYLKSQNLNEKSVRDSNMTLPKETAGESGKITDTESAQKNN